MMHMTDLPTPRTDAALEDDDGFVLAELSRQLERELQNAVSIFTEHKKRSHPRTTDFMNPREFQNETEAAEAEAWTGAGCAAAHGSAGDWKPILTVKPRNAFAKWCIEHGPRFMRLIRAKSGDNPFTFSRGVEIPAQLGKSGLSLIVPIPDQICNQDGSGPITREAFLIWCEELWRLLRGEWEKTFNGILHEMQRTVVEFTKAHPTYGKQLAQVLKCDPKAEKFLCDGSADKAFPEAMAKYRRWMNDE